MRAALALAAYLLPLTVGAQELPFTGTWTIDLRTPEERKRKVECGRSSFELIQEAELITGDHTFFTVGCGRLNEGGPETVKGVVVGKTAILVVTSGRNGAVVLGKATLSGNRMHWEPVHDIKAGESEGDSPLILGKASLRREK
jgi:hypothetical protein